MDARSSFISREVTIPEKLAGGGSGLEITTWLGDLGGAAGMLSIVRINKPKTRAITMFKGSSFGGSVNLEGDIAAYLIARDTTEKDDPSAVQIKGNSTIADALEQYLLNTKPDSDWNNRAKLFLMQIGGKVENNTLVNKDKLLNNLTDQILTFAKNYASNRLVQYNQHTQKTVDATSRHIKGATKEVATIFIDTLIEAMKNPQRPIEARGEGTEPSPPGDPISLPIKVYEALNKK